MLSEYRQRFSEFHTELYRDDYLFRAGWKPRRETTSILREYSDLFTSTKVEELRNALRDVPRHRETESSSMRRLIGFAIEGSLAVSAQEITEQIEEYESSAQIDWDGQKIALEATSGLLANESNASRRRDIYARSDDLIRGADDLRRERFERFQDVGQRQGYPNSLAMYAELRGVDFEKLVGMTDKLLTQSESHYINAFASLLAQETNVAIDDATEADLPRLQKFSRFDSFFSPEQMSGIYRELFAALGFNTLRQSNIEIDSTPRLLKNQKAFCSPIRVPDEIKLVYISHGGLANYRELLREAGHAQQYSWTSRNLYPEFRVGGSFTDGGGVEEAWGMLLENLMLDEHWLMSTFGFVESKKFRRILAIFRMMTARLEAALLQYEVEFHAGKQPRNHGTRFVELMTDAVRVRFEETESLRVLDGAFRSANALRAYAFESQLREYLKTKFGLHWWASRKAGEMLIDLWNTGLRYTVEELASMIGLGELDFDWLVSDLQSQIME